METQDLPQFDALLLAAGSGQRFGLHLGMAKQFVQLAGQPVWVWSARSLLDFVQLRRLILILPEDSQPEIPAKLAADPRLVCITCVAVALTPARRCRPRPRPRLAVARTRVILARRPERLR